ncbi:MAG TPA: helix-turn-helix domain-containing protein [Actinocrinis sp.]|uniref:ArsR/SmtB family transcription factor n=1 Tax=Actinocrinis sp. TaxID=1920516 RepID=UPI002DDCC0DC|nr:helix-turn-helix domain-containing protein [Actinocrinis sp.]HEV2345899.1 helix-turn-helix domain-containing protein [Actinocrinis sp.]
MPVRRSPAAALLAQLYVPQVLPGFLAPAVAPQWHDTRLNALRFDPDLRRADIEILSRYRQITPLVQALADNDAHARTLFARALGAYQKASLDGWMSQIDGLVRTEHHDWARLAAAGPDHLLNNLHPALSWKPPVLHLESAVDADIRLEGVGLLIQPTFFGVGRPWLGRIDTPRPQAVLYVPLRRQLPLGEHEPETPASLTRLLGGTRASVLAVIADEGPSTTGNIAQRLDCSPSAVSNHTEVLRESGLITTVRDGQSVRHTITELGTLLRRGPR